MITQKIIKGQQNWNKKSEVNEIIVDTLVGHRHELHDW